MRLGILIITVVLMVFPVAEAAAKGTIIQISRKLKMQTADPLPEKEYFISLGRREDIRIGDVFEVSRDVPVVDALSEGDVHLMKVVLGEVRIHFVGETISLGRLFKSRAPAELPPLEYPTFMLGDQVELKSSDAF